MARSPQVMIVVLLALGACETSVNLGDGPDAASSDTGSGVDASATEGGAGDATPDVGTEVGVPEAESGADAGVDAGPKRIFVTRATYAGDFGGLDGGDFRCQSSADAQNFKAKFVAWLSDSQTDAADHVKGDGPWVEVGSGRTLFANHAALRGYPQAPPTNDELGAKASDQWWTGTLANGVRAPDTCNDWSSASQGYGGMTGMRSGTGTPGKEWTEYEAFACVSVFALLCLEQ
jgi:hypothetical protein